jgi:hypothetical protein
MEEFNNVNKNDKIKNKKQLSIPTKGIITE